MKGEQVQAIMYVAIGAAVAIAFAVHWLIARKRNASSRPATIRRHARSGTFCNGANIRFEVGRAYWCRDKGWGDSAHQIIRRGEKKALISCDVIEKRSDVEVWRTIRVVDGVETMERGNIRADDEYTGKRGLAPSYAAAKERRTAL